MLPSMAGFLSETFSVKCSIFSATSLVFANASNAQIYQQSNYVEFVNLNWP